MNATIDLEKAEEILKAAIAEVKAGDYKPSSRHIKNIHSIILGTHLTFRYILVNGLLAKATCEACNPLSLQAGADLEGAFDARSLCHKVLVPVERQLLGSRLGGSNEPFLNKPARFPALSESNAVRRGSDTTALRAVISTLSALPNSSAAYAALKVALFFTFKRSSRDIADILSNDGDSNVCISLIDFAEDFIRTSVEGETCALLAGAAFSVLGKGLHANFEVIVHPVNQSGASSKEISDVDVFLNGELIHTAEVKDKDFTAQDVEHAVGKVASADHRRLIFLVGPRGKLVGDTESKLQHQWEKKGFTLVFLSLLSFFRTALALCPGLNTPEFADILDQHAKKARVKDDTIAVARQCLEKIVV